MSIGTEGEVLFADACIVATRLHQADVILPDMEHLTGPLRERLTYNPTVVVNLDYAAATHTKALGLLPGTAECEHLSLVWFDHNKDPSSAPPRHSLVGCYFDAAVLPAMGAASDEDFTEIAEAFVLRHFPELKGTRDMVQVTRWADAIPSDHLHAVMV